MSLSRRSLLTGLAATVAVAPVAVKVIAALPDSSLPSWVVREGNTFNITGVYFGRGLDLGALMARHSSAGSQWNATWCFFDGRAEDGVPYESQGHSEWLQRLEAQGITPQYA
jgi:hypothetical protein